MDIPFYKLHAFGNDLILINTVNNEYFSKQINYPKLVVEMCNRHTGVGANGVIFIKKGIDNPASVMFFNSFGEEAFSFDILLCLARYLFDTGMYGKADINIEIGNDIHSISVIDSSNFQINLGNPKLGDKETAPAEDLNKFSTLEIDETKLYTFSVSIQNKSNYFYAPEVDKPSLKKIARTLYQSQSKKDYEQAVFILPFSLKSAEFFSRFPRGRVDVSQAAAIALTGAVIQGISNPDITMMYKSYDFFIDWSTKDNKIRLTSSAEYVFTGSWYIDHQ